jgi:hypothetical protein
MLMINIDLFAQTDVYDLVTEIERGNVQLESITGNGSSSGAALYGYLVNQTNSEKRINVFLTNALYFLNRSARQNMIATQVYLRDGGYYSDGNNNFINLEPNQRLPIYLYSYCADFEKDNPEKGDSFQISSLPKDYLEIVNRIRHLENENPDRDYMAAGQVALWLKNGATINEIRERFEFTQNDETIARRLLQD